MVDRLPSGRAREEELTSARLRCVKAIVIGCGRVGSSVALQLHREGWDVVAVDEKEEALSRLGDNWHGGFVVGHGMDPSVLRRAGIEDADAMVVVDRRRQHEHRHRPGRAEALRGPLRRRPRARPGPREVLRRAGMRTVCPTSYAIEC